MRKLVPALALFIMSLPAYLLAQDSRFTIEPQYPQQGERIRVSFNPAGTELQTAEKIDAIVYWADSKSARVDEMSLTKEGNIFIGSFELPKTAAAAAFTFVAGEKRDNNQKKGYIIQVYDDKKQLVPFANKALFRFYGDWDGQVAGITRDNELATSYMEKEYKAFPGNKRENFYHYYLSMKNAKKSGINEMILAEVTKIEAEGNLTEENYNHLSLIYKESNQKEKADAMTATMKEKFPMGNWKKSETTRAIYAEKNAAKREALVEAYIKDFNIEPAQTGPVKWLMAAAYADEKKWDKFFSITKDINMSTLAFEYGLLARKLADSSQNLDMAKKIVEQSLAYTKNEIDQPTGDRGVTQTKQQWYDWRKTQYGLQAHSYASVLYKLGDYKKAYPYSKEAADINKRKYPLYNDLYATLLEKMAPPAQVKTEVEAMIKEGAAGNDTREVLKRNYIKLNKSENGFDEYLTVLDAVNIEKIREKLKKEMISRGAPSFRLVNMEGTEVDFASLKGKVVVLDFWATWCGPCIASFPAMQKMVAKYKNNKDVVFLFIDTWERVPEAEKIKLVNEFIGKHKYTFNVLYDKKVEPNSSDYVVVKDYEVQGIPTKFVVDGNGQIRFRSMGWSSNEITFMQELQLMIELAGQAGGSGEAGKKGF